MSTFRGEMIRVPTYDWRDAMTETVTERSYVQNRTIELQETRVLELPANTSIDGAIRSIEAEGYAWRRVEKEPGTGKMRMWIERC